MFKRGTERVKRVIYLARQSAARYRHAYHGTAHLLRGRCKDGEEAGESRRVTGGLAYRAEPHRVESHLILPVVMLSALVMGGCYGGNDSGSQAAARQPSGPPSSATSRVSFAVDIQPIFTQNCAKVGCHSGTAPAQGLNLQEGVALNNIVLVSSREVPTLHRVEPGSTANSYLFRKITGAAGISGSRMPQDNPTFFDRNPELLDLVRQWILEGAQPLSVSFAMDIQPILTQNCATAGCHNAISPPLGLNVTAGVAIDNIVLVPRQDGPTVHAVA